MTRRQAWKSLSLILVGIVLPVGMHATQTWDLTGLYSGASNPDSVYSYRDLSGNLFNTLNSTSTNINWDILAFSGFSGNRWTTSAGTDMAGFAKNTGWTSAAVNWPTFSMGGVSYDIRWTAPFDTTITVGGDVWMMRNNTNPSQQSLTVLINGVSQGAVNIDKASRAQTPETFQTAYNNVSFLQNILVLQGQTLDFRIGPANISQMADFVGIDLVITGTDPGGSIPSAPEPGTIATLLGGLGIVAIYRRRRA